MRLQQDREGIVFIDGAAKLRYKGIIRGSVVLYSDRGGNCEKLIEDIDYSVNCTEGIMTSITDARITDYSKSGFYGVKPFDHTRSATFGNYDYTYYADYSFDGDGQTTDEQLAYGQSRRSPGISFDKDNLKYVVFGDSISTGAEASGAEHAYFNVFAKYLEDRCGIRAEVINKAVGGETSDEGIGRFREDVLSQKPDLVSIAFGMNDQNRRPDNACGHFVEPEKYKENIRTMAHESLLAGAQVILISPCLPNPDWMYTSGDMMVYARCLKEISAELGIPLADVSAVWSEVLDAGKTPHSLLLNDINHPNDYGHMLYARTMMALV
ncbi:MAG: SGNH/GDSL hydrolase family protein [Saccharofermentanales bacterium]